MIKQNKGVKEAKEKLSKKPKFNGNVLMSFHDGHIDTYKWTCTKKKTQSWWFTWHIYDRQT